MQADVCKNKYAGKASLEYRMTQNHKQYYTFFPNSASLNVTDI